MIKVTNERTRGAEMPFEALTFVRSIDAALNSLVEFELGYGGRVVSLDPTRIVVVTYIMNCRDTTTFEGSVDDMKLLVEVSVNMELIRAETQSPGNKLFDTVTSNIMRVTNGNPLMVKLASGLLMGQPLTKLALACCFKTEDKAFVSRLLKLSIKDLCALLCLVRRDGASLEEALDLAESTPVFDNTGKIAGLAMAA